MLLFKLTVKVFGQYVLYIAR